MQFTKFYLLDENMPISYECNKICLYCFAFIVVIFISQNYSNAEFESISFFKRTIVWNDFLITKSILKIHLKNGDDLVMNYGAPLKNMSKAFTWGKFTCKKNPLRLVNNFHSLKLRWISLKLKKIFCVLKWNW